MALRTSRVPRPLRTPRRRCTAASLAVLALLLAADVAPAGRDAAEVVILKSSDAVPYREAVEGFRTTLSGLQPDVRLRVLDAGEGERDLARAVAEAQKRHPALILTLGTRATLGSLEAFGPTPIVAGLLLHDDELEGAPNATGVCLEYPMRTELEWLHRVLPDRHRIGMLWASDRNAARVEEAKAVADSLGLVVHDVRIDGPDQIPAALEGLRNRVDVLLGVVDATVFNGETIRTILLFSFRNRIPVAGISAAWVRAGALCSLDRDYADIGSQCAAMADSILTGHPIRKMRASAPRRLVYALNVATAHELKLDIPEPVLADAAEVVR